MLSYRAMLQFYTNIHGQMSFVKVNKFIAGNYLSTYIYIFQFYLVNDDYNLLFQ